MHFPTLDHYEFGDQSRMNFLTDGIPVFLRVIKKKVFVGCFLSFSIQFESVLCFEFQNGSI